MGRNKQAALGFIFVTLLIDVIGLGIIIPILPDLIIELTDVTTSVAAKYGGWLIFSYAIMQFVFAPFLGGLSDKYGRRPVLLFSLFGFGLDYILMALAPTIGWLFLGRILAGLTGASFTTASAYIADISPPEKRSQNFGMIGMAFGLGFIIGPSIGGILGEFGTRVPFFAAAGLSFLNWLYGYFILPESLSKENRRPFEWKRANPIGSFLQLKRYPVILGLVGCLILIYIAGHATQSTWSFYTKEKFDWNSAWIGYSLTFVGLVVAIVQGGLIRVVIPKIGEYKSVYIGLTFYAIGFLLFGFANEGWMMFAFTVPYALGGIAGPALQGIISNQVPSNEQGELQGLLTSLMSVTAIIGPVLMTSIFAYYTDPKNEIYFPGAPFMLATVLTIFSVLIAVKSLSQFSRANSKPNQAS